MDPGTRLIVLCVLVTQLCLTLYDPTNCSPPTAVNTVFSRQEYWSGLPFPSPGDLHNPGIKLVSPAFPAFVGRFFTIEPPGKPIKDGTGWQKMTVLPDKTGHLSCG